MLQVKLAVMSYFGVCVVDCNATVTKTKVNRKCFLESDRVKSRTATDVAAAVENSDQVECRTRRNYA